MTHPFFERHQALLQDAADAVTRRGHWTPYPEVPSGKIYGETAHADGKAAFEAQLGKPFALAQCATGETAGQERSPYGFDLGIVYPKLDHDTLLRASATAAVGWRKAGLRAWAGVALEILARLNRRSFEIGYATMHTTGQAFVMAFQAGGPHAQDRGLEAVAWAWRQMSDVPATALWEKPQGKNAPLRMEKQYRIVPRGTALVIGCCTFPTWNSYPGLFASLATGNTVVVKPHPGAILPLAITVEIARDVLREAGFDPNVVMLAAHDADDDSAAALATRPEIRLIDFTGSSANGDWLEQHARQAQVYTEKAGVNQVIVDSTDDLRGMARNLAFSLTLYSGQMCTAPQNIYIPKDGIDTSDGRASFDTVAQAIADAVADLTADPAKALDVTGAIQNDAVLARIERAKGLGEVVLDSRALEHPQFPDARIRTPLLVKLEGGDEQVFMDEHFGPIAFAIATDDTAHSLALAAKAARERGALTLSLYARDKSLIEQVRDLAADGGVALSINLTGGVFVNQSAAFSDFHGTGANPAANASLTDAAFVANRFRVVQSRTHV
jgi:phenylacetic acid degradation protein paaN